MVMESTTSAEDSPASTAPSSTASETGTEAGAAAAHTAEKPPDDTSKLRMFLGILRK